MMFPYWYFILVGIMLVPFPLMYWDSWKFEKKVGKDNVAVSFSERSLIYSGFFFIPIVGMVTAKLMGWH